MRAGSVLAVATEGKDINAIAETTERPNDVIGLRFAFGLRRNRLVEFAAPGGASPKAVATARALMRKIDRLILDVQPSEEGVATRLAEAMHAAADMCVEDGARVGQVDAALRDWGIPFGSFSLRDIIGLASRATRVGAEGQRGGGLDRALIAAGRFRILHRPGVLSLPPARQARFGRSGRLGDG